MSKYIEPWSRRRFCLSLLIGLPVLINKANEPCPGEDKLQLGITGMTPKIFFCLWPMQKNSKRPRWILTRYAPLCSIQYHWRDSSAHKITEPFNLQRAASKDYTSELKHWPTFWSKRWLHNNCNSCTRGHNTVQHPVVFSSSGAILVMPPTKTNQAIHLTDQLTRKWGQRPATSNLMMQYRDSIFTLGIFPDANLMKRHDRVPAVGCFVIELSDIWRTALVAAIPLWVRTQLSSYDWHWRLGNCIWMKIAKEHMRGLWEAFRCCCCHLLTPYVLLPFHFGFTTTIFTQLGISRWSICIGACHAGTASWCDLRDPGWGDPGFRHHDLFWFLLGTSRSSCLVLALCCCFKDDPLRTGHTSCLVITSHCRHWILHSNCDVLFLCLGFGFFLVCLFLLFGVCVFVFGLSLFLFLSWNGIIDTCTTNQVAFHSIGSTCNN